jgi:ClpP class serine protease
MPYRVVQSGEVLAMLPEGIKVGRRDGLHAMWWDYPERIPENQRVGADADIAVVHIRGALEHRAHYGDSYEQILKRVSRAMTGHDVADAARSEWLNDDWRTRAEIREYDANAEPAAPPKVVILRIDSPGGVVAGLNETVRSLQALRAKHGIPLIAYVDELMASAAYALSCACDQVFLPNSGITGSIGVISSMFDQTAANKKDGLRFVTMTSGARKADGHPNVAISDEAIAAEQARVDRMARQFFAMVSKARGMSVDAIKALEAGIFLGGEAVKVGIATAVATWDEVVRGAESIENDFGTKPVAQPGTPKVPSNPPQTSNGTPGNPRGTRQDVPRGAKGKPMILKLRAMVASLQKRFEAAAKGSAERKTLRRQLDAARADLAAATKIKKKTEEYSEETDDAGDEEEEAEEGSGNETDREEDADGDDDDDGDEEDEEEDEEEAEESSDRCEEEEAAAPPTKSKGSKASLSALVHAITGGAKGQRGAGRLAAVVAKADAYDKTNARLAKLERDARVRAKGALIDEAVAQRRITRHEAKTLRAKPLSFVTGLLEMRQNAIVHSTDDTIRIPDPKASAKGAAEPLPADVVRHIAMAVQAAPDGTDREKLRAQLTEDHQKRLAAANGANGAGRY